MRLKSNAVLAIARLWQRAAPPAHKIQIPSANEGPLEFLARARTLFADPRCYIYIDTSFLMWLTRVGGPARAEFFDWLERSCPGRYSVPVWAAHEYQRHHGSLTLQENLGELRGKLDAAGRSLYRDLRPYLDVLLDETAGDVGTQQANVIKTLNDVNKLSDLLGGWKTRYPDHAAEVIAFINAHVAADSGVFGHVSDIRGVGENRYTNRIPPGFQDRGKGDALDRKSDKDRPHMKSSLMNSAGDDSGSGGSLEGQGSNKFGDLIFWKEIIELAKRARAEKIIVITNDEKNDWQMAGRLEVDADDEEIASRKRRWKVPVTHPMLVYEAAHACGATDVLLMSSAYLAGMLLKHDPGVASAFVDVALVPSEPKGPSEREGRRQKEIDELSARQDVAKAAAAKAGYLFADPASVALSPAALRRALLLSNDCMHEGSPNHALFMQCATAWSEGGSLVDILVDSKLADRTTAELVGLTRALHDVSLTKEPGSPEPLADLLSRFDEFPPKSATCLYLGMLASMYFSEGSRQPRVPPHSPMADQLFERAERGYASLALDAIQGRIAAEVRRPLFVPGADTEIVVQPRYVDINGQMHIDSLLVNDVSVFTATQRRADLNLSMRLHGPDVTMEDVIKVMCRVYGIPWARVTRLQDWNLRVGFTEDEGFRAPSEVMQERAVVAKEKSGA